VRPRKKIIGLFGALLAALLGVAWFETGGVSRAPDVTLDLIQGGKVPLTTLRAQRPVLITFWATDCPGCRKEVPHLVELYERYKDQGFDVIAVAMAHDPPGRVWTFVRDNKLPYKVALDLDRSVAQAFGNVRLTPTTYVVARDGRIVFHKIGEFDVTNMRTLVELLLAETV